MPRTNARDLRGRLFGRLRVIEETEAREKNGTIVWRCSCACGREALVSPANLTTGNSQSRQGPIPRRAGRVGWARGRHGGRR